MQVIHAKCLTHGMTKKVRVDDTLDFEFLGYFQRPKKNRTIKKMKNGPISVNFYFRKQKQKRKYDLKNATPKEILKLINGSHFRSKFMSCRQLAFDLEKSSVA